MKRSMCAGDVFAVCLFVCVCDYAARGSEANERSSLLLSFLTIRPSDLVSAHHVTHTHEGERCRWRRETGTHKQ